jgi:hypothetical protein
MFSAKWPLVFDFFSEGCLIISLNKCEKRFIIEWVRLLVLPTSISKTSNPEQILSNDSRRVINSSVLL